LVAPLDTPREKVGRKVFFYDKSDIKLAILAKKRIKKGGFTCPLWHINPPLSILKIKKWINNLHHFIQKNEPKH
jgi:hypothetical protein